MLLCIYGWIIEFVNALLKLNLDALAKNTVESYLLFHKAIVITRKHTLRRVQ